HRLLAVCRRRSPDGEPAQPDRKFCVHFVLSLPIGLCAKRWNRGSTPSAIRTTRGAWTTRRGVAHKPTGPTTAADNLNLEISSVRTTPGSHSQDPHATSAAI